MKERLLKIANYGIDQNLPDETIEKLRLVNGISLLGVPICSSFVFIFGLTGFYIHTLIAAVGIIVFILPLFINKYFGLDAGRIFISIFAPVYFGFVSVVCGRDAGFYLGFIVTSIPPLIIYSKLSSSIKAVAFAFLVLGTSIVCNIYIAPLEVIPYSMAIYLLNFTTVLTTCLVVVYIFKNELSESREHLREKNKEVHDSIQYARRIQDAILPPESFIKKHIPDIFLLYKPKDIVAGDFYWMETIECDAADFSESTISKNNTAPNADNYQITFIAAADCTGHGVPGAMVSVVCHNALNRAVREFKITETGKILDKVTDLILETFEKSENDVKDGMDISLLAIIKNAESNEISLQWSGANNSLWYFANGQHMQVAADKQPIGLSYNRKNFTTHTIDYQKDTVFYLFTDGFADQFGGPHGKKFMRKQLLENLLNMQILSLHEQKNKLENILVTWRGKREQIDDVTMIGLKI